MKPESRMVTSAVRPAYPRYLQLAGTGKLAARVAEGKRALEDCRLCPRACGVNRLAGEVGFCRSGAAPVVASHNVHHGEEPAISGARGSGTVFFSNCTLRCLFCQNYPISQLGVGNSVNSERLAVMMLELQRRGAHNINFVTPTHFVPQIVEAISLAIPLGFHLPIVYNTSGYDGEQALHLMDGIVDIYLPDAKYADNSAALTCSKVRGYVEANQAALKEMRRQAGDLVLDEGGIAKSGMIIRHLVLPYDLSGTREVLRWVAQELSPATAVSLMGQYFPVHKALDHHLLNRYLTWEEYHDALEAFESAGLESGFVQEYTYHE